MGILPFPGLHSVFRSSCHGNATESGPIPVGCGVVGNRWPITVSYDAAP
jgi:hypothetical protein